MRIHEGNPKDKQKMITDDLIHSRSYKPYHLISRRAFSFFQKEIVPPDQLHKTNIGIRVADISYQSIYDIHFQAIQKAIITTYNNSVKKASQIGFFHIYFPLSDKPRSNKIGKGLI